MLFETILVFEVIGFVFFAISIFPTAKTTDLEGNENKPPFFNKIICGMVAAILFGVMGMTSNHYDYNYCYSNETISHFELNKTTSTATCASYSIESIDLSYINYGLAVLSSLIITILIIFAGMSRVEG